MGEEDSLTRSRISWEPDNTGAHGVNDTVFLRRLLPPDLEGFGGFFITWVPIAECLDNAGVDH